MPLLGTTKAHQSAKPDASSLVKAKTNAPTHRIDQRHADNPIGKILPFSVLEVLYLQRSSPYQPI
jgi:hypothetical protein